MSPNAAHDRYCPSCHHESNSADTLCPYCGETLRVRGFCATCQANWSLPVGQFCPKHDQELLDPSEAVDSRWADEWAGTELVAVRTYSTSLEADAVRLRLEAEGIPTFLEGERMGSASFYSVATGGVKLKVPKDLAADARVLLSQSWSLPAEPDDDLEDAWDDLAPDPGARRRSIMKIMILVILFGPTLAMLFHVVISLLTGNRLLP